MAKGIAVVGQSGGPTSVINSSLCGVIQTVLGSDKIEKIYGMHFAIEGFMKEDFIDLSNQPSQIIEGLKTTPSSALGSSRYKLQDEDLEKIYKIIEKYNIRYFFMIGGNDTMDTICRVEKYCREKGYELFGIGIPKTVDNDLFGTDHTPGYPSAARYVALSVKQGGLLARDMQKVDQFTIYQAVGRDAGWLAAAAVAAKEREEDAPHLIYMPEVPFKAEKFLEDFQKAYEKYGYVSIVCGEGIKYEDGTPVSQSKTKDKFSNIEFGAMGGTSAAMMLHRMIREKFGFRGEFQVVESLQMCAQDRTVKLDIEEAYMCGKKAVELALEEKTGYMVTLERVSNSPYEITTGIIELDKVAIKARPMPREMINEEGNFVTEKFVEYIKPLVGEMPKYVSLI